MKAEFNGMKLEGTPEEIMKFMELRMKSEKVKINLDGFFKDKPSNPYTSSMFVQEVNSLTHI
jgi:hypothetical protein